VRVTNESLSELIFQASVFSVTLIFHAGNDVNKIEQYRQMPFVEWKEEAPLKKNRLPVDTEEFWIGVLQHKAFQKLGCLEVSIGVMI